jgi:hypothetical protein
MKKDLSPCDWELPHWHADFGDPISEFGPLKAFACHLISVEPRTTLGLKTPEPGLLYVLGFLPNGKIFEVYSVPSPGKVKSRRLAVFANPDTAEEVERYFDALEDAVAFITERKPEPGIQ